MISHDPRGALTTLVATARGMTDAEAERFLATGVYPDLSQPPADDAELSEADGTGLAPDEVRALLAGEVITAAGGLAAPPPTTFKFNPGQDRWPPGTPGGLGGQWKDDGLPGVDAPNASAPTGKLVKPAIIYKKHVDGAVVAQRGGRRLRWNAGAKKYSAEELEDGAWVEKQQLTKTAAYSELKDGDWREASVVTDAPTTAPPAAPPVSSEEPEVDTEPDSVSSETPEFGRPVVEPAEKIGETVVPTLDPVTRFDSPTSAHIDLTPEQREIDSRIRAAFRALEGRTDLPESTKEIVPGKSPQRLMRSSGYVGFADLREELTDIPREQLDEVLIKLSSGNGDKSVFITPENAQFGLLQRDRDAALIKGNQPKHWLKIMPDGLPPVTQIDPEPVPAVAEPEAPPQQRAAARVNIGTDQTAWVTEELDRADTDFFGNIDGPGNSTMVTLGRRQGFAEPPQLGTSTDLDSAIAAGGVELWRGVTGRRSKVTTSDIVNEFKRGQYLPGHGIYGNGYYTSVNRAVSRKFADNSDDGLLRMVLPPNARIIDLDDLTELVEQVNMNPSSHPELAFGWGQDAGHVALMLGYDAVRIPNKDDGSGIFTGSALHPTYSEQYVILNRGALLVED